jgi:hypothetical protein
LLSDTKYTTPGGIFSTGAVFKTASRGEDVGSGGKGIGRDSAGL